jgi:major membrane immunogen (membrane-anchored lipoprotein)
MFGLVLRVITADGEDEVPVTPRVIVAFEREFQTGLGRAFQSDQKAEHMFWLGWKASGSKKAFDTWLDGLIDVQIAESVERPLSETP